MCVCVCVRACVRACVCVRQEIRGLGHTPPACAWKQICGIWWRWLNLSACSLGSLLCRQLQTGSRGAPCCSAWLAVEPASKNMNPSWVAITQQPRTPSSPWHKPTSNPYPYLESTMALLTSVPHIYVFHFVPVKYNYFFYYFGVQWPEYVFTHNMVQALSFCVLYLWACLRGPNRWIVWNVKINE